MGDYEEMAIEIFYDSLVELLSQMSMHSITDADALHKELNEENATSDYCTWHW
jgi:ubiquitin thioesterase protein OTUB1